MLKIYHITTGKGKPIDHLIITYISSVSAFLMMFQIYMVSAILPQLNQTLQIQGKILNLVIPSFTISIALASLFSGKVIRYYGELKVIKFTLVALALSAFAASVCFNASSLILTRVISGLSLGSLLPMSFLLTARNFSINERAFPIMIIVLGMAGGMTFGPVFGTWGISYLGWRLEFAILGSISLLIYFIVNHYLCSLSAWLREASVAPAKNHKKIGMLGRSCILLFILLNGVFHSGLFVWTNATLFLRYDLNNISKGIWLLDFGLPGLVLVILLAMFAKDPPLIKMEFIGLLILVFCIVVILLEGPEWLTLLAIAFLSIGYNISQPLFFGLMGRLGNNFRSQQYIELGCCFLFLGYGLGPLIFGFLMEYGNLSTVVFLIFLVASLAIIARVIFENED